MRQRCFRWVLISLIGWLLVGCSSAQNQQPRSTIVFGATISVTGKTAKEGEYALDGYMMFIDTINAQGGIQVGDRRYTLKLRYYDDQSNPERTTQLYEKLINEDNVDFLLGPYGSASTAAAAAIAEKYQIPLVSGHGSANSIYSKGYRYILSIQSPAQTYLQAVLEAIIIRDPTVKTVAVVCEDDPFSREVMEGVLLYAPTKGLKVVYSAVYPLATQDISSQLTAIKALQPDVLLGAGHLQDALLLVRQARQIGVSPKAIGLSVGPSSPQFRENLREDADYILGSTQWTSAVPYSGEDPWRTAKIFVDAFKSAYPNYKSVPYQVAESVAALIVFQRGLEQAQTLDREIVRDTLAGLSINTFFGHIMFDEHGVNATKPMIVEQLQPDGKKYTVYPPEVAEQSLLYPMPPWSQR